MAANGLTTHTPEGSGEQREETRAPERFLRPAVNIMEEERGLILSAELPGASQKTLDIQVDRGVLTINAPVSREMPGRPVYSEFAWAPYYRQFQIPDVIDQTAVRAEFTSGVLTLRLPKAEAARPRRIEVSVGD